MSFGTPVRNGLSISLLSTTSLSSGRGLRPSLALNFLSGTLDSRITFSRGTQATLTDSTGKVTYAPNNLLTNSESFEAAVWSKASVTVSSNTTEAPNGTTTADTLTATLANGALQYSVGASIGNNYIFSIWIKRKTGTGAVSLTNASGTYSSVAVDSTWQRFYIASSATDTSCRCYIRLATNGDEIYIWGAQLEQVTYQTTPGTYVATTSAAYYGPRFDYDPVTLAPRGLLVEEQRTNLLLRSEEFDNASWTKSRSTITANATTSPDGTVDADKLVEDTTATATHRVFQQASKSASSVTRTFSVYLKAAERTFARVSISDNTEAVTARVDVDLSAGTINTAAVFGGTSISSPSASISLAGNGWYRVSITATFDATITNPGAFVFLCSAFGVISYTGNGTSGIFVWGAQWEDGSFATSYIPTVASQVTRTADVATITGANFSQWYNQSEGTFVVEADSGGNVSTIPIYRVLSAGSGGDTISLFMYNGSWGGTSRVGSVFQADLEVAGTYTANVPAKTAFAFKADDFAASVNGSAVLTDTSGTVPTVAALNLGSGGGSAYLNGHIRSLTYYNTRLPNARLQALTS